MLLAWISSQSPQQGPLVKLRRLRSDAQCPEPRTEVPASASADTGHWAPSPTVLVPDRGHLSHPRGDESTSS